MTVSSAALAAIYAPQTDEVFVVLATIDHPSMSQPRPKRLVNNTQNVVSRGDTYTACPFQTVLPQSRADQLARAQIRIYADPKLVAALRGLPSALSITLEVIMASEPDTVQSGPFDFTLQNMRIRAGAIVGEPGDMVTPSTVPGLF